jgi:hypothetical protein
MTDHTTIDGDATVRADPYESPVSVSSKADVYVTEKAVSGDLRLANVEYVYTHQTVGGSTAVADPATRLDVEEDVYLGPGAVDGDVILDGTEDVFIEAGAVAGEIVPAGPENVFANPLPPLSPDERVTGWRQSFDGSVDDAIAVTGINNDVHLADLPSTRVEVRIAGLDNKVTVDGPADVRVRFAGHDNTLEAGDEVYLDVEDTGQHNDYPAEDPYDRADATPGDSPGLLARFLRWLRNLFR